MKSEMFIAGSLFFVFLFLSGCSFLDFIPEAEDCGPGGECPEGFACDTDGKCHVCGDADMRVCCEGGKCEAGLVCVKNQCRNCGKHWEYCCEGDTCEGELQCSEEGKCRGCGLEAEDCCDDNTCKGDLVCFEGKCSKCGDAGYPCCDGQCNAECLYCGEDGKCHVCLLPGDPKECEVGCVSRG